MAERLRITWASLTIPERGAILAAGALIAQAAQVAGSGISKSIGAGVLEAQPATVAGRGGAPVIADIEFRMRTATARTQARTPGATISGPRSGGEIRVRWS